MVNLDQFQGKFSLRLYGKVFGVQMPANRYRVAILGTGNIGTDLLYKVRRNKFLKCSYFVGRRSDSPGLLRAETLGVAALSGGIEELAEYLPSIDLVFDATSARDHLEHAPILLSAGVDLINLTPAKVGDFYVPGVVPILEESSGQPRHLNMVTCGGQATIPLIYAVKNGIPTISEVEIVSTISSSSAGPATRLNLDEYIENTEKAISQLTGIEKSKVMLVLNPAKPEISMHTSVYLSGSDLSAQAIDEIINLRVVELRDYCPDFQLTSSATKLNNGSVHFSLTVVGAGDYLPKYAGNLDIINLAAIKAAEELAASRVLL